MEHAGRVAIVTGGAGGLGAAVAARLAASGAQVIVADIDDDRLAEVVRGIAATGGRAVAHRVDVRDPVGVEAMIGRACDEFGGLHILVTSAVVNKLRGFLDVELHDWNRIIGVNLTGTFIPCQAAARVMARRGAGRIVNFASHTGVRGIASRAPYAASKAAVINLTQSMAIELAPHGITVNAVAPGPVATPLTAGHAPGVREALLATIPLKRYGTVEEIVAGVMYLVSDAAAYVTGHVLSIDGGYEAAGQIVADLSPPGVG